MRSVSSVRTVNTRLWVPETRYTSRDLLILVEQSVESVATSDVVDLCFGALWQGSSGSGLAEGAVRSVFVEMVLELVENGCRVSLVEDQDAVEEFAADGADEAFVSFPP